MLQQASGVAGEKCQGGCHSTGRHLDGDGSYRTLVLLQPLTPDTENTLDAHAIGRLAPGAVVLNPGRVRVPGSEGDFSWGGMASTMFWIDPVLDLTCVFFTQLTPSSSYPCRAELKALVHGALVE